MLFRQVPNMIECMLYMVQPSETQSWSSDMSQEENSTSWKWGHVFFTGCLIFDNTQKLFDFCLRVYAWPGDQLYSVFTDCIVICYRPQVTPTKNIGKAFERTPVIVGKNVTIRFLHVKVQSTNIRASNTKFCVFGRIPARIWAQNMGYPWKEHPK